MATQGDDSQMNDYESQRLVLHPSFHFHAVFS